EAAGFGTAVARFCIAVVALLAVAQLPVAATFDKHAALPSDGAVVAIFDGATVFSTTVPRLVVAVVANLQTLAHASVATVIRRFHQRRDDEVARVVRT